MVKKSFKFVHGSVYIILIHEFKICQKLLIECDFFLFVIYHISIILNPAQKVLQLNFSSVPLKYCSFHCE